MQAIRPCLKNVFLWLIYCCFLCVLSCSEGTAPTAFDKSNIVISGFLYTNEQVNDIRVVNVTPAGTQDTTVIIFDSTLDDFDTIRIMPVIPINDAKVSIYANGVAYPLVSINDSGFYGDPGNSLKVTTGVTYRIEATYLGKTATAETVVPGTALDLTVSRDTVYRAPGGGGGGRNNRNDSTAIQLDSSLYSAILKWNNPDGAPYYIMMEQIEEEQRDIPNDTNSINNPNDTNNTNRPNRQNRPNNNNGQNRGRGYFIRGDAISITSLRGRQGGRQNSNVSSLMVNREGAYEVRIYRVNSDYRELDQFVQQQERAKRDGTGLFLEEPPSNVVGGLGIFAAFAATIHTIYVVRPQ